MVEFALVAPMAFLVLLGLIVLGIVVMNQIQLTNAVREIARAEAVCGGDFSGTATLPDGTPCTNANASAYLTRQLSSFQRSATGSFTVYDPSGVAYPGDLGMCKKGWTVTVTGTYAQPLFLPLVDRIFGTGSGARTLNANGSATCEQ